MILPIQIPATWVYTTTDSYNAPRAEGYPSFLTDAQKARVERIRQARLLFDGRHRQYYLDENRTQFDFAPMLVGNRTINPYLTYNLLRLIALKSADLLFGDEPVIKVEDPYQQQALAALVERTSFHRLLHSAATDCIYEAETFIESCVMDGEVYVQQVPSDEIFPDGPLYPDGQFKKYTRFSLKNIGTTGTPIIAMLETTYLPGRIERRCWQMTEEGKKLKRLDLSNWQKPESEMPASPVAGFGLSGTLGSYSGPVGIGAAATLAQLPPQNYAQPGVLQEVTFTGIDDCTITWIPNLLVRGQPVSDFDGLIDLQDELNAKQTQVARILAKHADPKISVPPRLFDDQGNFRADMDVVAQSEDGKKPEYIVWDAQLKSAMDDREFTRDSLLTAAEMSPILLGVRDGSRNDHAYKTVKVQSQTSLKKAARKAIFWKAGTRRILAVSQALENALPGTRYEQGPLSIDVSDGIPIDEIDEANRIATLRGCGSMSLRRSIEEQIPDHAGAEAEIAELEKENEAKAAANPFVLGGPSPELDGAAPKKGQGALAGNQIEPGLGGEESQASAADMGEMEEVGA